MLRAIDILETCFPLQAHQAASQRLSRWLRIMVDKPLPPQPSGAFAATQGLWEGDTEDAITSLLETGA